MWLLILLSVGAVRTEAQTEVASQGFTTSGTSSSTSFLMTVPAGRTLVVQFVTTCSSTPCSNTGPVTVTDGVGTTYTQVSGSGGDAGSSANLIRQMVFAASNIPNPIPSGTTITVTHPTVTFRALKVFDIGATGGVDLSEGQCGTHSNISMSSSAAGQTVANNDVAVGLYLVRDNSGTLSPTGGWVQMGSPQVETLCGSSCRAAAGTAIIPNGGALRATATWSTNADWCAAMVAFKPPASLPTYAHMCYPEFSGVPFTYQPPAVDSTFYSTFGGKVDRDTGWTHAFRYGPSNGTPAADVGVQAIQNAGTNLIYLSFQMNNDATLDTEDSIVIGFDPQSTGSGAQMQRIIIHPLSSSTGTGQLVKYWKGYTPGGSPAWANPASNPSFVTAVSSWDATAGTWDVQMSIDASAAGLGLPAAGTDFRMYVNLVRVDTTNAASPADTQFTWPPSTPLRPTTDGSATLIEGDSLPLATMWGTANLTTTCSGVHFTGPTDITSNHNGMISTNQPNQFSVKLYNDGSQPANDVKAFFQIANYGLPAPDQWVNPGQIFSNPMPGNPAVAASPIGANGGMTTLSTGMWSISTNASTDSSVTQNEQQYYTANPDTCIRVSLQGAPDTTFSVQSDWNNFEIGTTSAFVHDATVGTKGYKLRRDQRMHQFDLRVTRKFTPACRDRAVVAKYPDLRYSHLDYVVHGCRHTGQFVSINGKQFENCESVGAFGYALQHDGPVKQFNDELTGEQLEKMGRDAYRLSVADGKNAVLRTRVVSVDGESHGDRGLCGQFIKPVVGAMLFFGILGVGLVAYKPRDADD